MSGIFDDAGQAANPPRRTPSRRPRALLPTLGIVVLLVVLFSIFVEVWTGRLWPGAFAEVRVALPPRSVIAVPGLALRTTERGMLAYVVVEGKAVERAVTVGRHASDGSLEITAGLNPGEQLVVRAADGLTNGRAVRVQNAEAPEGKPVAP